ncbi:MAG: GAF domain-containing protein [Sedimentisphaerales bacterium]|nr:GAF domain-containing protein [Sedimentisphaerales bacterium]
MDVKDKQQAYDLVLPRIRELIAGETDRIAVMATVACELHHAFDYYDWTGFYRVVEPGLLKVGPYQGSHGCLTISFDRGVCGAAARLRQTQIVPDVHAFPGHIACSASTRSEIVVPVMARDGTLIAVLDVDSDRPGAFDEIDGTGLEEVCAMVGTVGQATDAG